MTKVAVVTGSNKGIGLATVRGLCKKFNGDVFLTARSEERGKEAIRTLEAEGLSPKFHQLDITNHDSIVKLRDFLKENYGGLDCLVNNAGIAFKNDSPEPLSSQAQQTIDVNYFATMDVCNVLFPILRSGARVCHMSSRIALYCTKVSGKDVQNQILSPNTIEDVNDMCRRFVKAAKEGRCKEEGFPEICYGMSKVGLSAVTALQQKAFDEDDRDDIIVNSCCPGDIPTDMSSYKGDKTVDEGAETPTYLVLLPPNCQSPRGNFYMDGKTVPLLE